MTGLKPVHDDSRLFQLLKYDGYSKLKIESNVLAVRELAAAS